MLKLCDWGFSKMTDIQAQTAVVSERTPLAEAATDCLTAARYAVMCWGPGAFTRPVMHWVVRNLCSKPFTQATHSPIESVSVSTGYLLHALIVTTLVNE